MIRSNGKVYCDNCGAELERNSNLCSYCGKSVDQFGATSKWHTGVSLKVFIIMAIIAVIIFIWYYGEEFIHFIKLIS